MKAEDKKGHKPFILKRSIGARILLAVFLILSIAMIFIMVFIRNIVSSLSNEYYMDMGELIATLTSEALSIYPENTGQDWDGDTKAMLRDLCADRGLYSIWVETSQPPYEEGINELYIAGLEENRYEEAENIGKKYPLSEQEKAIFKGRDDKEVMSYKSSHGNDIIAYLHGIYDDNDRCKSIIGVNFDKAGIHSEIEIYAFRMSVIIGGIFLGLMIILGIYLHVSIFNPLTVISERMRDYVRGGNLSTKKLPVKGKDELSRVAASYNKMTDEISEYVKKVGVLEKEKLTTEAEVNAAAQIQTGMLPPPSYNAPQIRIEAFMKAAKDVAGDFYDYLPLSDGRTFFCVADVSGKGISAAIFMAAAVNALRYNTVLHCTPAEIMRAANDDLCARNPEMLFVTAFVALYDPSDGTLTYCNAGHNPAYLARTGSISRLTEADGLFLGLFPGEKYTEATVQIAPGDTLFMYTDGLTEAMNAGKAMFGRQRMEETLREYTSEIQEDSLTAKMEASVENFVSGTETFDDLTMMAVRFGRSAKFRADTSENSALRKMLLEEQGLPEREKKRICLAAEEIFVNICNYAYDNKESGTVRVSTLLTNESYTIVFADDGVPYDPLKEIITADEYDPDEQVGGLGKLVAVTIMDRQKYEYKNGSNVLTLVRSLHGTERGE